MFQFARVGAAVPKLQVADCRYNADEINRLVDQAYEQGVKILAFPELCITGYTCGDLFFQSALQQEAEDALDLICTQSADKDILLALGMPVRADNQIFNCAVLVHKGRIVAVVPKSYLPNHNEFYEERWFSSAFDLLSDSVTLCGQQVSLGTDMLFCCESLPELVIGVEICEDLWCPIPPSSFQAGQGANLILNLSASNELVAKSQYRRELITGQSSRLITAYVYASAGMFESTTDTVFGGHSLILENGSVIAESALFQLEAQLIWADVDIELLMNSRRSTNSFMAHLRDITPGRPFQKIALPLDMENGLPLRRSISTTPFVPSDEAQIDQRCGEIFAIQQAALARRLLHTNVKSSVIAISGGLDSTLALLCTVKAYDFLGWNRNQIIGITMPGFGTTGRTYNNALELMKSLGIQVREIDIKEACALHFQDIGHSGEPDVTYENAQARERMQIGMDIANMENGLVVGTGDLSELALGFTTYNGDHMSMYSVNCGIPKTLVRTLVNWVAQNGSLDSESSAILLDILDTPVSPELLPPGQDGGIQQRTEDLVGPYELHDFFLYHMVRNGFAPDKLLYLAGIAFEDDYTEAELIRWLQLFLKRFFSQQFKRSCVPDGPKIGSVALSPRGDWRMPSDASARIWLKKLEAY